MNDKLNRKDFLSSIIGFLLSWFGFGKKYELICSPIPVVDLSPISFVYRVSITFIDRDIFEFDVDEDQLKIFVPHLLDDKYIKDFSWTRIAK